MRRIAVAQSCPVAGEVAANVDGHLRLAAVAAAGGAQIVVFPELSLTGYEIDLAGSLAFSERDPRLAPLRDLAVARSIVLIVGGPVRIGGDLHIGAFILSPDRTIDVYTKHHLGAFSVRASCDGIVPPPEATAFRAGDRNPLVRFGGNVGAVAVCADVGRPSHPARAAAMGAKSYLASMFVIPSDFAGEIANLEHHARQHSMVVAFANFGAASGGLAAAGQSAIWSETGEVVVRLGASGSGVAIATESPQGWRSATH